MELKDLKEMIVNYSKEHNKNPSTRDLKRVFPELPYHSFYERNYGMTLREIIDSCDLKFDFRRKPLEHSDDDIIAAYKEVAEYFNKAPGFSDIDVYRKIHDNIPSAHTMRNRFGSIEKLANICGLLMSKNGQRFSKQYLITELQRFYSEFGRIPVQKDFEKPPKGYPSRKSFANNFGSFDQALMDAGLINALKPEYTKDYLISEIHRFIAEFGRQPFTRDMDETKTYPCKKNYINVFGSWNSALKFAGLESVRISYYTDDELESHFRRFVEINGRIPAYVEFNNNKEYPSFWCYQNRYGSWNKAIQHFGFEPNQGASGIHRVFENGEICKSRYEFDVSTWLRQNKISYLRNVPYKDLIHWYDGRKDCDYVIIHNGEFVFVEVAGLYTTKEKKSRMERDYVERFDHKVEHLLSEFNNKILYPDDFKKKTLDEMFSFLFEIECPAWEVQDVIYQGM